MDRKRETSNRKETSIARLFLHFTVLFCIGAAAAAGMSFLLIVLMENVGAIYPANYAETFLSERQEEIRTAERVEETMIPPGSDYGVYETDGTWAYGSFDEQERDKAWEASGRSDTFAGEGYFYRFILREDQKRCIVRYRLEMRYRSEVMNRILPRPEWVLIGTFLFLFFGQTAWLVRYFSGKLKRELSGLKEITDKIAENDLEFTAVSSELTEVNEVVASLAHLKEALQESLERQWDMEREKTLRLRALSHDIKTPLTIIRGNAELMAEEEISGEQKKWNKTILENTGQIESYLTAMRNVLKEENDAEELISVSADSLQQMLFAQARQMAEAKHLPIEVVRMGALSQTEAKFRIRKVQILRAWENLVGNALEYTDPMRGIRVEAEAQETTAKSGACSLRFCVIDYGNGFSRKDLLYGTQEFYRGDDSRHDRSHQGLGLTIAKRFIEAQGGKLELKNSECPQEGGQVSLYIAGNKDGKLDLF